MAVSDASVTDLGLDGVPAMLPLPWVSFSGTIPNNTEAQVVDGGTVVMTLHNDEFSSVTTSEPANRTTLVASFWALPGPSPTNGWMNEVRAKASDGVGAVYLTDSTTLVWEMATIGPYDIDATENLYWSYYGFLVNNWGFRLGKGLTVGTDPIVFTVDPFTATSGITTSSFTMKKRGRRDPRNKRRRGR